MMLSFPFLHRELSSSVMPEGAQTLDPGLGAAAGGFLPPDLPLDARAAKGYLAESMAYGESFASARDMAAQLRQGRSPLDPEGSGAIRSGLLGGEERARREAARKIEQVRLHAQAALLFAWTLEERLLDLVRLDGEVDEGMEKLRHSLGIDEDGLEDDFDEDATALLSAAEVEDPRAEVRTELLGSWRTVLRAMSVLVPEADFVTAEKAVFDDLVEEGVRFAPCSEADVTAPGALCGDVPRALLWKGAGEGASPEGVVRVVFLPAS